jgi:hypothetical protein
MSDPIRNAVDAIFCDFVPNSVFHLVNEFDRDLNVTVSFNSSESVTAMVIKGGSLSIKSGLVPPVVTLND